MELWNDRWGRFLNLKSLRPRLLVIVALALGPLALASIGQGVVRFQTRNEELDARVLQTAMYATGSERSILSGVELFLNEIAQRPNIRAADANCAETLSNTLIGRPIYLSVSLLDANGKTRCGASSVLLTSDYAAFKWWPSVLTRKGMVIGRSYYSATSGRTVLPVALPMHDQSGAFTGAMVASIDMAWLNSRMEFGRLSPDALMMIVTRDGAIAASNRTPPNDLAQQIATRGWMHPNDIFSVKSDGKIWQWAAQPVAGGDMLVAFGAPEPGIFDMTRIYFLADILLPLLMIALASVAIWLGTEWLVIRWTTYLQRVSAAYGQNHFALELTELDLAPEEFRSLGLEMKEMATSIRDRDRKLNRAIRQETAMASEIHHRVKNNLQIVASLIGLYSQRVKDPQSQVAFRQIVARVDVLTLVHRLIEKNDTLPTVDMKALFGGIADQMRATANEMGRDYHLSVKIDPRSLPAATATPIALFAAEVLSFGMFKSQASLPPRDVTIIFANDGTSHLLLTVEDNSFKSEDLRAGVPSPQRFLTAFTDQLQACFAVEDCYTGCRLTLRIPIEGALAGTYTNFEKDDEEGLSVFQFRAGKMAN